MLLYVNQFFNFYKYTCTPTYFNTYTSTLTGKKRTIFVSLKVTRHDKSIEKSK